jgi:hypothetical protein
MIRLDDRRCGERGVSAPPSDGRGWSAIRADLEREAEYLRMADMADRVGCPHTARKFRADAAAAVSRWRTARISTFPGVQPRHIPGQLSIL